MRFWEGMDGVLANTSENPVVDMKKATKGDIIAIRISGCLENKRKSFICFKIQGKFDLHKVLTSIYFFKNNNAV